jgi:hypothetical protein
MERLLGRDMVSSCIVDSYPTIDRRGPAHHLHDGPEGCWKIPTLNQLRFKAYDEIADLSHHMVESLN